MATLHIEHAITDLGVWTAAFDRFAQVRREAGVKAQRVLRPVDDDHYIVIDLEFDTSAEAAAMLHVLRTTVWATPALSPALVGGPEARILQEVDLGETASVGR